MQGIHSNTMCYVYFLYRVSYKLNTVYYIMVMIRMLNHVVILSVYVCATVPMFDIHTVNITVKEKETAILPCSVSNLGDHRVRHFLFRVAY